MRTADRAWIAGLIVLAAAAPARAQDPPAAQPQAPAAQGQTQAAPAPDAPAPEAAQAADPKLIFEREVFTYPGRARRDPFMPLTGANAGVLFSDLKLKMILYDDDPRESIAAVSDAANKQYRLRRGDTVGNATVVDIGRTRVVFSVSDFGIRRQEVLELKPLREGA
ncbi:MAG TPA: hypothetical protein VFZ24_17595 [Longimicrobiales bacterium]